jgi:hypothetical protein
MRPFAGRIPSAGRLRDAGELMRIRVLDHIIIGNGGYCSFVDSGYGEVVIRYREPSGFPLAARFRCQPGTPCSASANGHRWLVATAAKSWKAFSSCATTGAAVLTGVATYHKPRQRPLSFKRVMNLGWHSRAPPLRIR